MSKNVVVRTQLIPCAVEIIFYKCLHDWQIAGVTHYSPNQRSCYTLPMAMGGRRCRCGLHDKTLVHIP